MTVTADVGTRVLTDDEREKVEAANAMVRDAYALFGEVFTAAMPVGKVQWIHIDRVQANDYNPNAVAHQEMKLLHTSISSDGYTQPVVAIYDPDAQGGEGRYIIVDGFHRYTTMKRYADIYDSTGGYLPVVVIDKPIADRIASTVRHNRARGKHSIQGMGNLVFQMLQEGESDEVVCQKLGLEAEELARLKHVTGYSKLYADVEYSPAVLTKTQQEEKAAYARAHPDEQMPKEF
jgi:ParB-like chromosome segregation protein Spo0J